MGRLVTVVALLLPLPLLLLMLLLLCVSLGRAQQDFCILNSPTMCAGQNHILSEDSVGNPLASVDVGTRARPWFADMDTDGDTDVVIGGYAAGLVYYRNAGNATAADLVLVTNASGVGEDPFDGIADNIVWSIPALADFTGDGLLDLLVSDGLYQVVDYFVNTGNATHAEFTAVSDADNPFSIILNASSDVAWGVSPFPVDIDGDGDFDVFAGELYAPGAVHYFENVGNPANVSLLQRTGNNNPLQGANVDNTRIALLFYDYDNDGDFDFLAGEYAGTLTFWQNFGSEFHPEFTLVTGSANPFFGVSVDLGSAPAVADLDGNGKEDLYVGDSDGTIYKFKLLDAATHAYFEELPDSANPAYGLAFGFSSSPRFADLDCDGDADLLSGEYKSNKDAHVWFMENVGTATVPVYSQATELLSPGITGTNLHVAVADLDDDDDIDAVIGLTDKSFMFYENQGDSCTANFVYLSNSPVSDLTSPYSRPKPELVDVDNDGDVDMVVGTYYTIELYENTGNASSAVFTLQSNANDPFYDVWWGLYELDYRIFSTAMTDLDGDNDKDLVVGCSQGVLFTFENLGSPSSALFADEYDYDYDFFAGFDLGDFSTPAVVDLEQDGSYDVVVGENLGSYWWFTNGRCLQDFPCSDNGGCVNDALYPNCTCFTGFAADQCNDCTEGFFGSNCELCPGGGTTSQPTLTQICSQQGVCADGMAGDGACTCNTFFSGDDCGAGSCPAGYMRVYNSSSDLYQCFPCPPGTYKSSKGNNETCTPCSVGEYSNLTAASSCSKCPPGTAADFLGATECPACAEGTFSSANGSTVCLSCDAGMFTNRTGSTSCTPCAPGSAVSISGASECIACSSGTFAATAGLTACAECNSNDGFTTRSGGATKCDGCLPDYYWDSNAEESCVSCQHGMDCDRSLVTLATLPMKKHFWRTDSTSSTVEDCPYDGACAGGNGTGDVLCSDGYEGPLCAVCASDFYYDPGTNRCRSCDISLASILFVIVVIVLVIVLIILLVRYLMRRKGVTFVQVLETSRGLSNVRTRGKILIAMFQVISAFPYVLHMDFPRVYNDFLAATSFVNLDLVQALPVDCVMPRDYVDELLIMTTAPLLVSLLLGAGYKLHAFCKKGATDNDMANLRSIYFQSFLLLTYLVFPSVSSKVFRTFSCYQLDDGESYMRSDYSVNCDSDRYHVAVIWAAIFILVYPVGIPVLYLVLLRGLRRKINPSSNKNPSLVTEAQMIFEQRSRTYRNFRRSQRASSLELPSPNQLRSTKRTSDSIGAAAPSAPWGGYEEDEEQYAGDMTFHHALQLAKAKHRADDLELRPYRFLYEAYEPAMWWWEVFECIRRLALTGLLVFFMEGTAVQIVVAMCIALFSIEMYVKFVPFLEKSNDMLAEVAQWETFAVLYAALLIRVGATEEDQQNRHVFSGILIMITVSAPLMMVVRLAWDRYLSHKNGEKRQRSSSADRWSSGSSTAKFWGKGRSGSSDAFELKTVRQAHSLDDSPARETQNGDEERPSPSSGTTVIANPVVARKQSW